MKKELERQDIKNIHDDFKIFPGMSLDSLPPHISYDAVVNATDGNSYLLLGGVFANKIESIKITKLVFDKDVLNSLDSGRSLPYTGQFIEDPNRVIQNSDIPWSSIGTGKYGVLEIGLYTSVYHMIPDAQKYYTARAHQLIPFYVPVTITTPTFATDGVR
ncbi:MAG: hypothetical protein KGH76_06605 [Thaumarchaeota archaeon]|nr:hypothetical protein [Nitrososphaerota archaeon]